MAAVRLLFFVLSCVVLAPGAATQGEIPLDMQVPYVHDTGWVPHAGERQEVLISFPVRFPGASSMRLYFEDVELGAAADGGPGSQLRLTSHADGAVQLMHAEHVRQWQRSSAYFNGDTVQVEVLADPGAGPSRIVMRQLDIGVAYQASQCGPNDDRALSSDARVARILPVACTAWMIKDCAHCFLSAGHCSGGFATVQFNVPLSTGTGSFNHPGPEDQYAVDSSSLQVGTSDDWAYFGCFANSTTGLTPFEAQSDAFELVPPPGLSGNTIRITGHGTDGTPSTHNQVQQTHMGPFTGNGSTLTYQADTEGGNSGSPVIWEQTNQAIGIHTNAGCSTSGSGSNSGTPITQAGLQAALDNPQGICAQGSTGGHFGNLGGEKIGFPVFTAPRMAACGTLEPDSDLTVTLTAFNPQVPGTIIVATIFVGFTLLDAPLLGGTLVPNPDIVIGDLVLGMPPTGDIIVDLAGEWPAGVPPGFETYIQTWISYSAPIWSSLVASNGLSITAP